MLTKIITYQSMVQSLSPLAWLRLNETSGTIAGNAMYTGGEVTVLDYDFTDAANWSGDDPVGWALTRDSVDSQVTQVAGGARFTSNTNFNPQLERASFTEGDAYRVTMELDDVTAGIVWVTNTGVGPVLPLLGAPESSVGTHATSFVADGVNLRVQAQVDGSGTVDLTYASFEVVKTGELVAAIGGTTTIDEAGTGSLGTAYYFDGSTSFLRVRQRAALNGLDELSLGLAIFRMGPGEGNAPDLAHKADEWQVSLNSTGNVVVTVQRASADATATTNESISAYQWQMVHVTYTDADGIKIYIDGSEATYSTNTTGSGARVSNANDIYFGNNAAASATFQGRIADITFFDTALSAANIAQLHSLSGLNAIAWAN